MFGKLIFTLNILYILQYSALSITLSEYNDSFSNQLQQLNSFTYKTLHIYNNQKPKHSGIGVKKVFLIFLFYLIWLRSNQHWTNNHAKLIEPFFVNNF